MGDKTLCQGACVNDEASSDVTWTVNDINTTVDNLSCWGLLSQSDARFENCY